jgi:hypothetical protein
MSHATRLRRITAGSMLVPVGPKALTRPNDYVVGGCFGYQCRLSARDRLWTAPKRDWSRASMTEGLPSAIFHPQHVPCGLHKRLVQASWGEGRPGRARLTIAQCNGTAARAIPRAWLHTPKVNSLVLTPSSTHDLHVSSLGSRLACFSNSNVGPVQGQSSPLRIDEQVLESVIADLPMIQHTLLVGALDGQMHSLKSRHSRASRTSNKSGTT